MKPKSALRAFLSISGSALLLASQADAGTLYWDGGDGGWGTIAKWSTDSGAATPDPSAIPGSADDVIFNITGANLAQNITLDVNRSVNSLTFNNSGTTNIRGNSSGTSARTLAIGSGGITLGSSSGAVVIGDTPTTYGAVNVGITADQTWTNNSASTLTLTGVLTSAGSLTKSGTGTVILSGQSTAARSITVSQGTLRAGVASTNINTGAFAGHSSVTLADATGVTLDLNGFSNTIGSLSGGGANGGNVTLGNNATLTAGLNHATTTYDGVISGTGSSGLAKVGSGTLTLTRPSSYSGATTVNAGTLALDFASLSTPTNLLTSTSNLTLGGGTLSLVGKSGVASAQTLGNLSSTINTGSRITVAGTGGGSMTLTLGNTWTRNAASSLNITLGTGGTLTSSPGIANGLVVGSGNIAYATVNGADWAKVSGGNVVAFAGGDYNTTFPDSGATSTVNYSLTDNGSVTATQVANTLKINTSTTGQSLAITAGQTLTLNAGGLLFVGADNYSIIGGTLLGSGGGQKDLVVHQFGGGELTIGSVIANNAAASNLVKTGTGVLTLSGANTYTGSTVVSQGVLKLDNATAITGGIGTTGGASRIIFDGGIIGLTAASGNFTRSIGSTNSDKFGFSANGTGGGWAAYGGDRIVNIGNAGGAINIGSTNGGGFYNGVLILSHSTADGKLIFQNGLNLNDNASNSVQTVLVNNGSAPVDAEITGAIANGAGTQNNGLRKTGDGTLVLSGANTYSAATTISGGTLQFARTASLYNSATASWTASNIKVNAGTFAINVGGVGEFTTGNVTTLLTNLGGANGTSTNGFAAGSRIGFDTTNAAGGTFTVADSIANSTGSGGGAVGLTKLGTGKLILTNTSSYTGPTTVAAGVLAVDGQLANTSTTVANTATLQGSGTIGGGVTVQNGGTIAAGNSIESLATGALGLESGSTFAYEINNDALSGVAGDLTAVTGNLTLDLGNAAILTLSELGSGTWTIGEKLTLISYSGTWNNGLFTYLGGTLADDSTFSFSGTKWEFNYNDSSAGTNYTGDLTGSSFVTMTAVPEPRAALLGSLGLLMLLRRRRN